MTTKIKKLDRQGCRDLRTVLEPVLQRVAQEWGISLQLGRCTFSHTNATFKLEAALLSPEGVAQTVEAAALTDRFGHQALGKRVEYLGEDFKLVGYSVRSHKYPFLVERADGKRFKLAHSIVSEQL